VITAFNFPVAVWAWNAALALVCGDPVIWKPSEKAPLTALACHALIVQAGRELPEVPDGLVSLVIGGPDVGEALARSPKLPLISATGSVRMGRAVATATAARLGRSLLELGGNNAMIVAPSARLELAERAALFAAVGTAGQRCTSLRRLIAHESVADELCRRLERAYARVPVGDPRLPGTLMGPLIDQAALDAMQRALAAAR
jgi:aldehyde dehydrogenase (NAD+)